MVRKARFELVTFQSLIQNSNHCTNVVVTAEENNARAQVNICFNLSVAESIWTNARK